jgi:RNA polymerase sigma-70 factor, ECF subfamily
MRYVSMVGCRRKSQPVMAVGRLMDVTVAALLGGNLACAAVDLGLDDEHARLVARARSGDAEAFGALIELHGRAARRVALVALGNAADADEAVQDACLTAWRRVQSLEDPAAFRAWLLRITWRKALDRRRSVVRWMHRMATSTADAPDAVEPWDLIARDHEDQERMLLARERDRAISRVIRTLPPKLRDPFLLAATGEHRYEEIATLLKLPVGTVKWRMFEARRVIREKLTRMGFVGDVS